VSQKAEHSYEADSENYLGVFSETMYYIGLDVHKRTISYCVRDAAGRVHKDGKWSTRRELDAWIKTLPQPRMIAMEATIFTGWIYDHLLPHAEKGEGGAPVDVAVIAAAKRKNDWIDCRVAALAGTASVPHPAIVYRVDGVFAFQARGSTCRFLSIAC
jgi:transposase